MNEVVQELKRHIRLLEDRAEWDDGIGGTLDDINSKLDTLDQTTSRLVDVINSQSAMINRMIDVINNHSDGLKAVRDVLNQIIAAINKPAAPPPPSPFNEIFGEAFRKTKSKPPPKRPSAKLKLVKKSTNAPPPDQPA
jgi:hypothetical protein